VSPVRVVFVCSGNTCRSPLAMALARRWWPAGVDVRSAGLQAQPGLPATEAARTIAAERGADLSAHSSRPLDGEVIAGADWLIAMTRSHVAQLNARLGPDARVRIGLLGRPDVDLRGQAAPEVEEVDDPFGASLDAYRATADQIERLLRPWQASLLGRTDARGEPA